ncbi:MAG: hypothetical protein AB2693_24875, partial [Candidatus Thiodiazotropha sp.]
MEGHTDPLCIVDADQDQLVAKMVSEMNHIANGVYELAEDKWGWVLEAIDEKLREYTELDVDLEDNSEGESDEEISEDDRDKMPSHPLMKIYAQLETYMTQVPVLGFNSAKYDLNLIKCCLAKH